MNDLDNIRKRVSDLGFSSIDDLLHALEIAEPRFVRIPSSSWSMELTVRLAHVYPTSSELDGVGQSDGRQGARHN